MDLIQEHYQWIFSGIGGAVIVFFLCLFVKNKKSVQQKAKGNGNIQIGGNVHVREASRKRK